MIDTNPAVARQKVVLTARLASVAAACQQVTQIITPQADHCFPIVPGDAASAVTSEKQQFFNVLELK